MTILGRLKRLRKRVKGQLSSSGPTSSSTNLPPDLSVYLPSTRPLAPHIGHEVRLEVDPTYRNDPPLDAQAIERLSSSIQRPLGRSAGGRARLLSQPPRLQDTLPAAGTEGTYPFYPNNYCVSPNLTPTIFMRSTSALHDPGETRPSQNIDALTETRVGSSGTGRGTNSTGRERVPRHTRLAPSLAGSTWRCFNSFRRVLGVLADGFAPLKSVMDELNHVVGMYEDAVVIRADYVTLKAELEALFSVLAGHFSGNVPPSMTAGMNSLCIAIENELDRISTREDRRTGRQYIEAKMDLDSAMVCFRRIQGHLDRLRLNSDLSMWRILDEQATETRLRLLEPSLSARYNSAEALQVGRRECTPDTREQVLKDLVHWSHDKNRENIYWMNGMAGTGKTTIASSFCAFLDRAHELGASFFCTRLLPKCRDVNLILPTIAYQLARFSRPFYCSLSLALQAGPDLRTKALPNQLKGLIVDPLCRAAPALPEHLVVVIDALDECEDNQAVGLFLEILAKHATRSPLKIVMSSRPEPQIRQRVGDINAMLILHELEVSIVKEDIKLHFQTELKGLSISISDNDLCTLVTRAGALFIYAATIVRYIRSATSPSRRQKRLRAVLEMNSLGSRTNNDIDTLYTTILASAFNNPELDEEEVNNVRFVLDTVICAQEPLTIGALAGLLGLAETGTVQDALEPLWSVLHISGRNHLVNSLHASFPDYMLDPTRSKQYRCQAREHHGRLAELCFDRISRNEPQFNICGIESSYFLDEDVPNLNERIGRVIPQDLWYACRYWSTHLKLGEPLFEQWQNIHDFMARQLFIWLEVLNLMKHTSVSISMLETVKVWCTQQNAPEETIELAHDAWRFATMFATSNISDSTAYLYVSMLASWPKNRPLSGCCTWGTHGFTKVKGTGIARRQTASLGVLQAGSSVESVALSPDGSRIASGSDDMTVRVWDITSGKEMLNPLRGHTNSVNSVAFSPDGMHIGSGSADHTVRLWDVQTGKQLLHPFQGHTRQVRSVAFSPDGTSIASGSYDCTVRLWDTQTGDLILEPLRRHTDSIHSVAFSPNGALIISGSGDRTICAWKAETGQLILDLLEGYAGGVHSVAFSPNGTHIASSRNDGTTCIWDGQTGKKLSNLLMCSNSVVSSIAFSPDGKRIVSGSYDHKIRIWDTQVGHQQLGLLTGHTDAVHSVALSSDGMRIVSGSRDGTIRIWDAKTDRSPVGEIPGHFGSIHSVIFSPNGDRLVSCSHDGTIWAWDAQTGEPVLGPFQCPPGRVKLISFVSDAICIVFESENKTLVVWDAEKGKPVLGPLKGHTGRVGSVAFSSDGMRIVSGSDDKTVRIWDAKSGQPVLDPLLGHTGIILSVDFSPDGTCVVSGSLDKTIQLWDAHTGNPLIDPTKGHAYAVNSVAFSPDSSRIVSGSADNTIRIWSRKTGEQLTRPLKGHTTYVLSVRFSPDGTRLVSGSADKTIRIWDAQTGKPVLEPLRGHTDSVGSVGFSPDGVHIVSGSSDATIRMWKADAPTKASLTLIGSNVTFDSNANVFSRLSLTNRLPRASEYFVPGYSMSMGGCGTDSSNRFSGSLLIYEIALCYQTWIT